MDVMKYHINILGHSLTLHFRDCFGAPWHFLPPCAGAGLVQDLLRSCVPSPQVVEQALNGPH